MITERNLILNRWIINVKLKDVIMFENKFENVTQDDKSIAMLVHFSGVISILGPLVIWLLKKDQSEYVNVNGKIALNFQIPLFLIGLVIGAIVHLIDFGGFILTLLGLVNIVLCLLNGYKAYNGDLPKYPISIEILK